MSGCNCSDTASAIVFGAFLTALAIFFGFMLFSPKVPSTYDDKIKVEVDSEVNKDLFEAISKALDKSFSESTFMKNDGIRDSLNGINESLKKIQKSFSEAN